MPAPKTLSIIRDQFQTRVKTGSLATEDKIPDLFRMKSASDLQCPFFLPIKNYHSLLRQYAFARKDVLIEHSGAHESGMDFSRRELATTQIAT